MIHETLHLFKASRTLLLELGAIVAHSSPAEAEPDLVTSGRLISIRELLTMLLPAARQDLSLMLMLPRENVGVAINAWTPALPHGPLR